jgi:peptide chain release factor subunit 1
MVPLWREELQKLAEVESAESAAVSFYFQPDIPENRAHRSDVIRVKDVLRDARRELEQSGNNQYVRTALERIAAFAETLHENGTRTKAIFACLEKDVWREFELPAVIGNTQLVINSRFHLQPFAAAVLRAPHCCVLVLDRERARIFDLYLGAFSLREEIVDDVPRRVRTNGFAGYDAGHVERHVDNEVMRHLKRVADRLQEIAVRKEMDAVIIGCRPELWPELEPHLHSYVKQSLIGKVDADPATVSAQQLKHDAQRILDEHRFHEARALVTEVMGEAQRGGRGALGLRRVIIALERGEVRTVVMGETFSARAVECRSCGHLDTRLVASCAICGQPTRPLEEIADALVGKALRHGAEIVYVDPDPDFESRGNIGALLRFRADQSTPEKLAG